MTSCYSSAMKNLYHFIAVVFHNLEVLLQIETIWGSGDFWGS
jgi:hypothetical protein